MSPDEFKAKEGSNIITVSKPFLKAAYLCLGKAWPRALSLTELREQARVLLGANYELADGKEQSRRDLDRARPQRRGSIHGFAAARSDNYQQTAESQPAGAQAGRNRYAVDQSAPPLRASEG